MKIDGRRNNGTDRDEKRTWGKTVMRYCPVNKVCWSVSKNETLNLYKDMPTYGLERAEIPEQYKQGER